MLKLFRCSKPVTDPEDHDLYEGRVFGEVESDVSALLEDGLMTATVRTKKDTYHIEVRWGPVANYLRYLSLYLN